MGCIAQTGGKVVTLLELSEDVGTRPSEKLIIEWLLNLKLVAARILWLVFVLSGAEKSRAVLSSRYFLSAWAFDVFYPGL